jgi:hypothetical protein
LFVASVERRWSSLTNCLPTLGLACLRGAGHRCSAAVWLERGQQLEHLESGVPTAVPSPRLEDSDGDDRH